MASGNDLSSAFVDRGNISPAYSIPQQDTVVTRDTTVHVLFEATDAKTEYNRIRKHGKGMAEFFGYAFSKP